MRKRPLALLLGITGDMGFAAGCLLLALRRHSPNLRPDILLFSDGALPPGDKVLLRDLGAQLTPFTPPAGAFPPDAVRQFSLLALARFEGFRLLDRYATVLWLDVDTAIQDDITPLLDYGPLSMAPEDPHFTEAGVTSPASINVDEILPDLDPDVPNLNSGVLVLRDDLPDPPGLHRQCLDWLAAWGPHCRYLDQPVLNMLAQKLQRECPGAFRPLPCDRFNAHPRNPLAGRAAIVHAFGAYKLWDDGLTRCCFPEWERDYGRWLKLGGSPWRGRVENAEYLEGGAFHMLRRLFDATGRAQALLEGQQAELVRERTLRTGLERALLRLSPPAGEPEQAGRLAVRCEE